MSIASASLSFSPSRTCHSRPRCATGSSLSITVKLSWMGTAIPSWPVTTSKGRSSDSEPPVTRDFWRGRTNEHRHFAPERRNVRRAALLGQQRLHHHFRVHARPQPCSRRLLHVGRPHRRRRVRADRVL